MTRARNFEIIDMLVKRLAREIADRLARHVPDPRTRHDVEWAARDVLADFFTSDLAFDLAREGVIRPDFTVDSKQLIAAKMIDQPAGQRVGAGAKNVVESVDEPSEG